MCAVFTPDAEGDSVARKPTLAKRAAARTRKPRSRWSVAIACGWRTSSTARSSNSSSRAISASATSCLPRTKSPNATASRGRWCARRCCACAPTGWSQRIRGWAPSSATSPRPGSRPSATWNTSAPICARRRCGWRWKAMPRAWRPCAAPTSSCARSRRRTRPSPNRWRRGACRPRLIWRSTPASPKPAATTSIWACWRAFTIPSAASCA